MGHMHPNQQQRVSLDSDLVFCGHHATWSAIIIHLDQEQLVPEA